MMLVLLTKSSESYDANPSSLLGGHICVDVNNMHDWLSQVTKDQQDGGQDGQETRQEAGQNERGREGSFLGRAEACRRRNETKKGGNVVKILEGQ